ncbi:hypothetical protein SCB49_04055 [unidentified eubacterium SCB49]|nr:hypothetical protein SCB49_04055 [unidentified eubacterium SCB49]
MTRYLSTILLIIFGTSNILAQVSETRAPHYIRTIQFKGQQTLNKLPIIKLGERLELSFDALNGEEEDFYYKITHHNFDWTESDLSKSEFLNGFDDVRIETYENSLNTLQIYSHYSLTIPNRETRSLKKSGNYLISIYNDSGDLIFSRKFMIMESIAGVAVNIKRSRDLKFVEDRQVVNFTINSPSLLLINPKQRVKTLVIKNNNLHSAINNLKPQYTIGSELIYKYDQEASFGGGNEFLAFDNKDVRAAVNGVRRVELNDLYENYLFTNIDRYDRPYTYNPDVNGTFVVNNIDANNSSIEAEYVKVHFTLNHFEDIGDKELHIYGAFNNWTIDGSTYMSYNESRDVYENSRLFKQGFYNFQYVLVDRNGNIDDGAISGNFWQTENEYTVLVYYRDQGGRFDRIIGVGYANSEVITNN